MKRRILIIDGHPDPDPARFVHALAEAYSQGARQAGYEIKVLKLAEMNFPLLRTGADFTKGAAPQAIKAAQEQIAWSNHLAIFYPLWLGSMPALLKGFFEQVLRPGFAFQAATGKHLPKKLLTGKSARIVLTMGMPGLFYKWYFRAHSLKSLERNILSFVGVDPVRASIIGSVESLGDAKRERWLKRMRDYAAATG